MAGFLNRFCALPKKLVSMGYLPASMEGMTDIMDTVGIYLFFIVIALFGIWVFGAFFKNIKTLKYED
jgi:hypothetical protein